MGTLSCHGYIKKGWKRLDWSPEGQGLLIKLIICTVKVSSVLRTVAYCWHCQVQWNNTEYYYHCRSGQIILRTLWKSVHHICFNQESWTDLEKKSQNALKQLKRNSEFSKNLILTSPIHHICIILIISYLLISDAQDEEPVSVWMNQCLISYLHRIFCLFRESEIQNFEP